MQATTKDGWTLRVFASMYLDWGLEITDPKGNERYCNPSALSNELYGHKPTRGMDWDEAMGAAMEGDESAFEPWTDADWRSCLLDEADQLIEAYCAYCPEEEWRQ